MATPMNPDAFVKAVRALGVHVIEREGWRTHNRAGHGDWGGMHGVMHHHTATKGTAQTVRIVEDGYAGLPGPLCHGMIAKNGDLYMIGWGRANHAGLGDGDVLQAVIDEAATLPPANEADTDGNAHFYGFECENLGDGQDPWPRAQLDTMAMVSYAICRHHQWTERSVIGHLEWQPGKPDPRGPGVTMPGIRRATRALLHQEKPKPEPKLTLEQRMDRAEARLTRLEAGG